MKIRDIKVPNNKIALFIRELVLRYLDDDISRAGAALAYYFVFSFFPFIIFVSTLLGYLDIPAVTITSELHNIIPEDILGIINIYIDYVKVERNGNILALGLFFTFYFPMRAVNTLMLYINKAYRVEESRPYIRHMIVVFIFTIFLMFAVIISLGLLTVGKTILTYLSGIFNISYDYINFWNYFRFLFLAVMLFITLSTLYFFTPGKKVRFRKVFPGAFAALISWLTVSIGFAYYVENMGRYSVLYGSIGAIIVLLVWLYFSGIIILMGAEFNHVLLTMRKK